MKRLSTPPVTPIYPKNQTRNTPIMDQQVSCLTVAQHIDNCPICSRLYDTDKTLYILAIIGLIILCFLMIKRIINI